MLIQEVMAAKAQKAKTPVEQRVDTLKAQLDQARVAAKRARINQQQQRLNQQRMALNKSTTQKKTPAL